MGAVIGGLYAAGMSGEELEEVVKDANWSGVFNPAPERDKLTYRQKQQQVDFPGTASLGVSGAGLLLPTGAVSDQALMKELQVVGPPTMLFLDGSNNEIAGSRLVGEITAQTVAASASAVKGALR